ncbi:V-set and immunoglobulin domain-containing protein 8-like, partial [Archocentrus centrarchus]|uniref:V-set and immunoglobulin domain-containing protein 8-like n=1 Tax=Archocentrus centrarchus TaxID=63155 RepID=UPI0011EA309B
MAALTLTPFFCFGLLCVLVFVSADQKIITAESGQNVTLTCRALNYNIIVVEWSRAAVDKEYVFLYRDGQFVSEQQHPSFKNRVDLQDRQMKDGDVSVILKDVTINDEGTYECRVIQRGSRSLNLISTITLRVVAPPVFETITAESGQNIILPCRAPNNNQIRAVVWAKPDLEDEHVYLYRDGRFDPGKQNPVYRNRVDLQDRQMKDGDVSLIMKDVTVNDSGTYECRVIQRGASRSNKAPSIIYLSVVAP